MGIFSDLAVKKQQEQQVESASKFVENFWKKHTDSIKKDIEEVVGEFQFEELKNGMRGIVVTNNKSRFELFPTIKNNVFSVETSKTTDRSYAYERLVNQRSLFDVRSLSGTNEENEEKLKEIFNALIRHFLKGIVA
jgi:hypothetical protein